MDKLMERKIAILAHIRTLRTDRAEADGLIERLRAERDEAAALAARWRAKADVVHWGDLDSGASIVPGDRLRYMLRTYECVEAHTKALTRRPADERYWREVPDDG